VRQSRTDTKYLRPAAIALGITKDANLPRQIAGFDHGKRNEEEARSFKGNASPSADKNGNGY